MRKRLSFLKNQKTQDVELFRGQVDSLAPYFDHSLVQIHGQFWGFNFRKRRFRQRPPQRGSNARQQFSDGEGFHDAIDSVRSAADEMRVMAGREIPMGLSSASSDRRAFTIWEPIGIVAAISAFNHPLNLIVHQVVPAVATGCPVIVKPANPTPLSCLDLVSLLHEAGLPPGWCQVFLAETNELAEALATDPRIAFLSFIGSARVGWHLRSRLPPGTRCALEHGGAAPVIIDRSADLDRLVEPLAKGGYYHAGQVCVSVQRIYVHADLEGAFLDRFAARVAALKVGDPLLAETEVGPLILPREADRVAAWIDEAVSAGARLIGGGRLSSTTLAPTIIVNPPAHAKV